MHLVETTHQALADPGEERNVRARRGRSGRRDPDTVCMRTRAKEVAILVGNAAGESWLESRLKDRTVRIATICSGCDAIAPYLDMIVEELNRIYSLGFSIVWVFACDNDNTCQRFIIDVHGQTWLGPVFRDAGELSSEDGMAYCVRAKARVTIPGCDIVIAGTWCGGFSGLNNNRKASMYGSVGKRLGKSGRTFGFVLDYCMLFSVKALLLENVGAFTAEGKDPTDEQLKSGLMEATIGLKSDLKMSTRHSVEGCDEFSQAQNRRRMYLVAVAQSVGGIDDVCYTSFLTKLKRHVKPLSAYIMTFSECRHDPFFTREKVDIHSAPTGRH